MTVKELYELAKKVMFEKATSKDYDGYYIPYTNLILAELFNENNAMRLKKGLAELTEIPTVTKDSDTLTYEDEYTREVMPYGMAADFYKDDDLSKFDIENRNYTNSRTKYLVINEISLTDVYADSEGDN